MSVRNISVFGLLLLASVVLCHRAGSAENLAKRQNDPFDQYATGPTEPRTFSLPELYEQKPADAVSVVFRVLSTGTHYAGRYDAINDANSRPIILESTKPTGAEKGNYFQVALVSDALTAVDNLKLESSYFKNRVVRATGIVQRIPETWGNVGRRVRYEIVIHDLQSFEVVSDPLVIREVP